MTYIKRNVVHRNSGDREVPPLCPHASSVAVALGAVGGRGASRELLGLPH